MGKDKNQPGAVPGSADAIEDRMQERTTFQKFEHVKDPVTGDVMQIERARTSDILSRPTSDETMGDLFSDDVVEGIYDKENVEIDERFVTEFDAILSKLEGIDIEEIPGLINESHQSAESIAYAQKVNHPKYKAAIALIEYLKKLIDKLDLGSGGLAKEIADFAQMQPHEVTDEYIKALQEVVYEHDLSSVRKSLKNPDSPAAHGFVALTRQIIALCNNYINAERKINTQKEEIAFGEHSIFTELMDITTNTDYEDIMDMTMNTDVERKQGILSKVRDLFSTVFANK